MKAVRFARVIFLGVSMVGAIGSVGCQVDIAGMTLPSPRYLQDDAQFFAPGHDFKFANEEAALAEGQAQAGR